MSPDAAPTDPLIGRTFSQYEIVAKLGGGGMGIVYKARDARLGRFVALKFLPPQWSNDDSAKQRFIREAQAASATLHKSICTIHDIEQTTDGQLFIVMALYEGETLKQRLERGPLPIADAVAIGLDVAEGLSKAHAHGVVHRDIKPGNIILTDDGAKIVDFGLAKFKGALQLTVEGSTIGTVAYMSPEQARGEEADAQSDIWAWGVVMFEMLTGAPPFPGEYPEATFYAIKNEPVPPMREAREEIPEALEQIVLPALEKDRGQRYATAREPARALRLLQGLTVPIDLRTEPVRVREALGSMVRRRGRWLTPLRAGIVAAIAVAIGAGMGWWWQRPVVRTRIAIAPVANHTGVASLDRYRLALTERLIDELSGSPNVQAVPFLRLVETVRPFMQPPQDLAGSSAVQAVASSMNAPFVVVPSLTYRDRDASWLMAVQIRNAETGTSVASFETPAVTSALSEQTAFRLVTVAADRIQAHFKTAFGGRSYQPRAAAARFATPDAARVFAEGLSAYEALEYGAAFDALNASAALDPQHAMTHAWLARVAAILGRRNEATAAANRARQLAGNGTSAGEAVFIEAVLAESQGDLDAAEAAYRRLVSTAADEMWALAELADFLKRRQDRNQQAIEVYHDLLRRDAAYVRPHVELCQLYTRIDDHPLAEREGQAALEAYRRLGIRNGEGQALLCLVEDERKQGGAQLLAARANVEAADDLFAGLQQPYNLARALFYRGLVEYSGGSLDEAMDRFAAASSQLEAVGNQTLQAVALMNLGAIGYQLGRPTAALEYFRRGRDVFLRLGDERRAAEADVNAAGVQTEYGVDVAGALRTLANARVNLERLGYVQFQIAAMQSEAEAHRQSGRLTRARTMLQAIYELARSRGLTTNMARVAVSLALADIQLGHYADARTALEQIKEGPAALDARIALGTLLTATGDFDAARPLLEHAAAEVDAQQLLGLRPRVHHALGALAVEAGDRTAALREFDLAIESWTDPLPNEAVLEAQCWRASLEGNTGGPVLRDVAAAIERARSLGHVPVEARCRVALAQIELARGAPSEALRALEDVPEEGDELSLGPELRAVVDRWRGEALRGRDAAAAERSFESARQRIASIVETLDADARGRYTRRGAISGMLSRTATR